MGKKAIREKNTSRLHFIFKVPLPSKYIVKGILDGQIGRKNNRAKFVAVLFSLLVATHAPTTHNVSFDKNNYKPCFARYHYNISFKIFLRL